MLVRCGGDWRRNYGGFYTGTTGEPPATAKELPTDYRASSRPYRDLISGDRNPGNKLALMIRLYHGGTLDQSTDSLLATSDADYAAAFAQLHEGPLVML